MAAIMETEQSTATFTVQPFATLPVDGDAGDLIGAVLTALEADSRAHGAVCGYDYEKQRIDAIFQVEVAAEVHPTEVMDNPGSALERAMSWATMLFEIALERAGVASPKISALSIVEGDDPDLLP